MAIFDKLPTDFLIIYKEWISREIQNLPVEIREIKRTDRKQLYLYVKYMSNSKTFSSTSPNAQEAIREYNEYKRWKEVISRIDTSLMKRGNIDTLSIEYKFTPPTSSHNKELFESIKRDTAESSPSAFEASIKHNDIFVRSKSEDNSASIYDELGLEYLYEAVIDGFNYLPDFTIYIPFLDIIIIHEHFGKMSDMEYRARFHKKIDAYMDMGFILGTNLLVTIESRQQVTSFEHLENQIAAFITNAFFEKMSKTH